MIQKRTILRSKIRRIKSKDETDKDITKIHIKIIKTRKRRMMIHMKTIQRKIQMKTIQRKNMIHMKAIQRIIQIKTMQRKRVIHMKTIQRIIQIKTIQRRKMIHMKPLQRMKRQFREGKLYI